MRARREIGLMRRAGMGVGQAQQAAALDERSQQYAKDMRTLTASYRDCGAVQVRDAIASALRAPMLEQM